MGSSCIYPKYAAQPMEESYLLTGELEPTNEPYAIAKIAAIKLCRYYNEQYGTNFISLMPSNLYGENDNFNLETSHVLPALIRKIILAKALTENDIEFIRKDLSQNEPGFGLREKYDLSSDEGILQALNELGIEPGKVRLWGTGEVKREFLNSRDVAGASLHFMEKVDAPEAGEFINVGSGKDLSIKEIAYLIESLVGFRGKIEFGGGHSDGTPRKLLDITKAKELGWQPKIDLQTGIKKVIKKYYDKIL
jgi:GDP-L-fucose synthase